MAQLSASSSVIRHARAVFHIKKSLKAQNKGAFGLKAKIEAVLGWRCSVPNYGEEVTV